MIAYNFSRNEDIDAISYWIFAAQSDADGYYYTTRNSKLEDNDQRILKQLYDVKATSLKQVYNLLPLLSSAAKIFRSQIILLPSPSLLNIPLIVFTVLCRRALYVAVHDVDPHYIGLRGKIYSLQNWLLFKVAKKIFVFSEFSAGRARKLYGSSIISVLPLPSPVEKIKYRFDFHKEERVCKYDYVWFGRSEAYKGSALLEVFAKKIAPFGESLLVISSDLANCGGLAACKNVTVINQYLDTDQLVSMLRQCRFNICPYESATQSGVISLCTYLGIPTIAHNVGGLSEQIVPGLNGIIVSSITDEIPQAALIGLAAIQGKIIQKLYLDTFSSKSLISKIKSECI